jgi:hypothetical protein
MTDNATTSEAGCTSGLPDVWGAGFSRDVEPSREGGSTLYDIMASCVKMFKNGNNGCTRATTAELCCIGAHS